MGQGRSHCARSAQACPARGGAELVHIPGIRAPRSAASRRTARPRALARGQYPAASARAQPGVAGPGHGVPPERPRRVQAAGFGSLWAHPAVGRLASLRPSPRGHCGLPALIGSGDG